MAKQTTKKKTGKHAPSKKSAAPAPKRASAGKPGAAELDPVAAAMARRRMAMLAR